MSRHGGVCYGTRFMTYSESTIFNVCLDVCSVLDTIYQQCIIYVYIAEGLISSQRGIIKTPISSTIALSPTCLSIKKSEWMTFFLCCHVTYATYYLVFFLCNHVISFLCNHMILIIMYIETGVKVFYSYNRVMHSSHAVKSWSRVMYSSHEVESYIRVMKSSHIEWKLLMTHHLGRGPSIYIRGFPSDRLKQAVLHLTFASHPKIPS